MSRLIGDDGPHRRATAVRSIVHGFSRQDDSPLDHALKERLDPNATDENGAPLLVIAAQMGMPRAVKRLLDEGANPNVTNRMGETALCATMSAFHSKTVADALVGVLIGAGADVRHRDAKGSSALNWAVIQNDRDAIDLLVDHGAFLEDRDRQSLAAEWNVPLERIDRVDQRVAERSLRNASHGSSPGQGAS